MDDIIELLKNNGKLDAVINFDNSYVYHGIYIPYFNDSSSITSILDKGLLTLRDQYYNGIRPLEKLEKPINQKTLPNIFKFKNLIEKSILSYDRNNVLFFSPNKNLFNRVFDISFVLKKDEDYRYRDTNLLTEQQATEMMGKDDYTEYIRYGSVLPTEFAAIRINLDELLNPEKVQERGSSIEEIVPRLIKMINDIYDKLEENNLSIPIINSNDNRVLDENVFRSLSQMIGQRKI